jgi:putative solute:sodium symporter small subunit
LTIWPLGSYLAHLPFCQMSLTLGHAMDEPTKTSTSDRKGYWRANLKLITILLSIWAIVSFGCGILFIEPLNEFRFFGGVPLGFWFAQQGSIYVFVVLIFVYAYQMDKLDKKYGVDE